MAVQIDQSRDALFDELGLMRLRESYMRADEKSPQERFKFVAETFGSNPEHAARIYEYASRHWLSFATPFSPSAARPRASRLVLSLLHGRQRRRPHRDALRG